jgi:hypothetical protein
MQKIHKIHKLRFWSSSLWRYIHTNHWIKIRYFPIPTPTQIHAWNNATATIIRQTGKKLVVVKHSMWMCRGYNSRQIEILVASRMLIIGQAERMLIDLRNSRGSTELSAVWMDSLVSGWIKIVSETFISILHIRALGLWDTAMSLLHRSPSAPTSCRGNHHLYACNATAYCSVQAVITFTNLILSHLWLCTIILKPTLQFFLQSGHLNWYMQHHTIAQGEPLLSGET